MKNFIVLSVFFLFLSLVIYEFYTQSYTIATNSNSNILAIIKNEKQQETKKEEKKIDYSNFEYVEH